MSEILTNLRKEQLYYAYDKERFDKIKNVADYIQKLEITIFDLSKKVHDSKVHDSKVKDYIDENCEKVKCNDCSKNYNLYKDQRCVGDVYFCIDCLEESIENEEEC